MSAVGGTVGRAVSSEAAAGAFLRPAGGKADGKHLAPGHGPEGPGGGAYRTKNGWTSEIFRSVGTPRLL